MSLRLLVGAEGKPGETRTAVLPELAALMMSQGIEVGIQPYPGRAFSDNAYEQVGARLADSARNFNVVIATKEWSAQPGGIKEMFPGQTLIGFHHCHKGQEHNLPTLKRATELGVSLFDYELFRPEGESFQPITTSRYAGISGAVNGIWALSKQLHALGRDNGTCDLLGAPRAWGSIEKLIATLDSLPARNEDFKVVVVGKTGTCGKGAIEVCKWLGLPEISADELASNPRKGPWFCALGTEDIVKRSQGGSFDHKEYREEGKKAYENTFDQYLGKFSLLVFCPYWDDRYPKLLPRDLMINRAQELPLVISDVTCDLGGSTECTLHENKVASPVSTYFPTTGEARDGFHPSGIVVTAVDNLPAQLGESCSAYVSEQIAHYLLPVLPQIETAKTFEELPDGFKTGFITWRGEIVPRFAHLKDLL